jgi:hypothetical protein
MQNNKLFLVFSERHLDGELMNSHDMRREYMRAKYKREYISCVEVDESMKKELVEVLDDNA